MLSSDYLSRIENLYTTYNNTIKLLIADIEAKYEKFPIELFNEIRALHDHIARCYIPDLKPETIKNEIAKAEGHIWRIILDCYKYLNIHLSDYVKNFEKRTKRVDLFVVDNGQFYVTYKKLHNEAISSVREAKKIEGIDKTKSLKRYEDAYNQYTELYDHINSKMSDINWAKRKYCVKFGWKALLWIASVILSSIITISVGCPKLQSIVEGVIACF